MKRSPNAPNISIESGRSNCHGCVPSALHRLMAMSLPQPAAVDVVHRGWSGVRSPRKSSLPLASGAGANAPLDLSKPTDRQPIIRSADGAVSDFSSS